MTSNPTTRCRIPTWRSSAVRACVFALMLPAVLTADNIPPSAAPPGGLAPANTPQLMLLTFDDLINTNRAALLDMVLPLHRNPNGLPIQATFFLNTDWTDYQLVRRLHDQGHEIAVHTMTHTTDTNTVLESWRAEIVGCRRMLATHAGIPLADITGFRAPYMMFNDGMFRILQEQGFTYDASVIESPGLLSTGGDQYIWPYTLDDGVQQTAWTGVLPTNTFPGLFEVPMWGLLDEDGQFVTVVDPTGNTAELLALMKTNFDARYNGNRAPMGLFLHVPWLANADHREALNAFIAWTQTDRSNVWWIGTQALTAFMRNPQTIAGAFSFPPFATVTNTPPPTNAFRRCVYDIGVVNTCVDCPPVYPRPDTVYVEPTPFAGGTVQMGVMQTFSTSYWARLTVSNNTPHEAIDWSVRFSITNGGISAIADGLYDVQGSTITIHPALWQRPLRTGELEVVEFGGPRSGDVTFTNATLVLYDAGQQRPVVTHFRRTKAGALALEWSDSAYGYGLDVATRLQPADWSRLADIHASTAWTNTIAGPTGYYRLTPIP